MKQKFILVITFLGIAPFTFSQNWRLGGNNAGPPPNGVNATNNILGTNINVPLRIHTSNTERMRINANTSLTTGFVGINTTNPLFPLHVQGSGTATGSGWRRGIMMSNQSALMWRGDPFTNRNYFMGHSSSGPAGNFYQGFANGIGAGVTFSSTVFALPIYFT